MADTERESRYGLAGRAAGEAALEHGRDGARIRSCQDAFVLSRIARAIVDALDGAMVPATDDRMRRRIAELYAAAPHEHDIALDELRDALDDAIRRAYCEPLVPPMKGEDPDAVREITTARILASPDAMRQLVVIQKAAWEVVKERVE